MSDILRLRRDFPILSQRVNGQPLVYLDNAATTQKPRQVISAIERYYRQQNANVHRASHALSAAATASFEQARETVAGFMGCTDSAEIIWTHGTTEGMNLLANSLGRLILQPGDRIVLSTMEHHANIVPWQLIAEQTGAVIDVIKLADNATLDQDHFIKLLAKKPKIVSIGHVSNALGTINPIQQMAKAAKHAGAVVIIDGAQAVPHFKVDITELECDFYLFSGHKLFAPTGIGVLWGKRQWLEQMPPWMGGGEMIEKVSFQGTRFNQLPFKFEAGTPNIAGAIGLAAAIEYLQQLDSEVLAQHEQRLLQLAEEMTADIPGLTRYSTAQHRVSLLSFSMTQHQQDIGTLLDLEGIAVRSGHHCAMPLMEALDLPGTIRASFAFYNTEQEIERFAETLRRLATSPTHLPHDKTTVTADLGLFESQQGWQQRYALLMKWGSQHQGLAPADRNEQYLLAGCESNVWLKAEYSTDTISWQAGSDARIINGLIALILALIEGKTAAEVADLDFEALFDQWGMNRHLSQSRGNGLRAITEQIQTIATEYRDGLSGPKSG